MDKKQQTNSENFLVKTRNLTKAFRNQLVFRDVNLTIRPGDKIALLGVNGCGKTTLIEILLGLKQPSRGEVVYQGKKSSFLKKTQTIYQSGDYPSKLKVNDIIGFYEDLFRLSDEQRQNIVKVMKILQLYHLKKKKINKLSFGQRKKLEAVLMLAVPTKFLIVDELTAGIDINGRIELFRIFKSLCESDAEKALIWITHDIDEISLCNRVVMMSSKDHKVSLDMSLEEAKQKFKTVKNMVYDYVDYEIGKTKVKFNKANPFQKQ